MRRPFDSDSNASSSGPSLAPFSPPTYQMPPTPGGAYAGGAAYAPAPPPPAASGVPTFFGLLTALKRRWVLGSFLGLLAGLAAAAGLWLGMPEGKHRVHGLLEFKQTQVGSGNNTTTELDDTFKRNQDIAIRSRTLLGRVCENKRVAPLPIVSGSDDAPRMIADLIKVDWPTPDVMQVSLVGNDPGQLRILLDELLKMYAAEMTASVEAERQIRRQSLEEQRAYIGKKIAILEDNQSKLSVLGVGSSPQERQAVTQGLIANQGRLEELHEQSKTKVKDLEYQIGVMEARLKVIDTAKLSDTKVEALLSADPSVQALAAQLEAANKSLETAKTRFLNPASPVIAKAQKRVDELTADLAAARTRNRAEAERKLRADEKLGLELSIEVAKAEVERLRVHNKDTQASIEAVKENVRTLSQQGRAMEGGNKELTLMQEHQNDITKQWVALNTAPKTDDRVKVRETPQITLNHNLKQKMVFSSAVALGAFVGVLGLVGFLEWRNRRVDGVEQVVNELGLRVIGTIPAFPSRASIKAGEADANQNWRFILNESVNSTRTMLLHSAKTQSMQVIMVTSAMQGEGKTSLASQLATSMATAGLRTLILDFDLRNPSMHRLFDINLSPGASEVVLQELDVSDAVQPTTVPNLWLIPAGMCSNRVVAALAQGHPLETLFNRLRGQFDFIVVDSCPILPVADALLIGQHVDGAVISILQDISQLPKVLNASERLTQLNIPLLGAVVNGIKTDIHAYGYNYVKQLPA